jgi:hypothetical protein
MKTRFAPAALSLLIFGGCLSPQAPLPTPITLVPAPAPLVLPPPPDPRKPALERAVLAAELEQMWTRDADRLVEVLQRAQHDTSDSPELTFLLAIAHAETNGRILDVSEAGAVGLAQATPVAFLTEHFQGKLYVTPDYIEGVLAYLLKKPLNDADTIASLVLEYGDDSLPRAKELLAAANELRSVGVDELNAIAEYGGSDFYQSIDQATQHNAAVLDELQQLIEQGDRPALLSFRDRTRAEYRALRNRQRAAWVRYQHDLAAERDRVLAAKYGSDVAGVKRELAYEAGEYLAEVLDARFSPKQMAAFLASHLRTKRNEAIVLGADPTELEEMTSALYNGGLHNVRRMRAGLIGSLPETENYMRKVPATKHRLDAALAALDATSVAQNAMPSAR